MEDLVNTQIRRNLAIETNIMDIDAARASGAMALFGEKYDDRVRVLRMGDFSTELCGGSRRVPAISACSASRQSPAPLLACAVSKR